MVGPAAGDEVGELPLAVFLKVRGWCCCGPPPRCCCCCCCCCCLSRCRCFSIPAVRPLPTRRITVLERPTANGTNDCARKEDDARKKASRLVAYVEQALLPQITASAPRTVRSGLSGSATTRVASSSIASDVALLAGVVRSGSVGGNAGRRTGTADCAASIVGASSSPSPSLLPSSTSRGLPPRAIR
jgi:hypothetical protein